jgi:hypothetical protein
VARRSPTQLDPLWIIALAAVLLLAGCTALLFGLIKSPELQELLRGPVRSLRVR